MFKWVSVPQRHWTHTVMSLSLSVWCYQIVLSIRIRSDSKTSEFEEHTDPARLSSANTHQSWWEGKHFSREQWNNWVCSWGSVWRDRINMCLFELKVCVCVSESKRLAGRLSLFYWRKNIHVFQLRFKPWESDETSETTHRLAFCHIFQHWLNCI